MLTNKINNKKYIGQTYATLRLRMNSHKCDSTNSKKNLIGISRAIDKYGFDNFLVKIIESGITCIDLLNTREIYWINEYKTFVSDKNSWGYNLTKGGINGICSKSTKKLISKNHSNVKGGNNPRAKPVEINGVKYECITYAAKSLGVQRSTIRRWLNGKNSCYHELPKPKKKPVIIDNNKFNSLTAAAEYYGVTYGTIWRWIKNNRGKYI